MQLSLWSALLPHHLKVLPKRVSELPGMDKKGHLPVFPRREDDLIAEDGDVDEDGK